VTVRGVGYRLVGDVADGADGADPTAGQ
jgi:hypothetical protein